MDTDQVRKLAELARIRVSDEDLERVKGDLASILDYVAALEELDIDAVEIEYQNTNVMREDDNEIESGTHTHDLMANAPKTRDGYVEVPKIL